MNNGLKIPSIGISAHTKADIDSLGRALIYYGYTHIDIDAVYKNETQVGAVLNDCFRNGRKREEFFISAKLHYKENLKVEIAIEALCKELNVPYLDLCMIPYPEGNTDLELSDVWK